MTDVLDNLMEKDCKDDLLTDITSKSLAKSECIEADFFGRRAFCTFTSRLFK